MYNLILHCILQQYEGKGGLVEVDVLVLLGNNSLEGSVLHVGNSEGLEDSGVRVSEVSILNLQYYINKCKTKYVESWGKQE